MSILQQLRTQNPALPLYSVSDPEFLPYGRLITGVGTGSISAALSKTPRPEAGNSYTASDAELEALPEVERLSALVFGGMATQCGFCNGHGCTMNAMEYHKCSEVNFSTTGLVLLLALPEDLVDGALDSASVRGFYLPPDTAVEIYPRVLHFAPCRTAEAGFDCLVILERGVNTPLDLPSNPEGEDRLLWMRGKWLCCHPDSPQAAEGAYASIKGENISLSL